MQYTVIIEPANDGTFSVYVPDLPGCISTGESREEAIESIREAIQGHVQTNIWKSASTFANIIPVPSIDRG
jgi:predicted RNase H-like HicB family nuclease